MKADVLVLGAGVMGTSIAFHLAEQGIGVTVVDRGAVAEGGSGRSSALIRMHYSFPPEVRLAVQSLEYFRNWEDRVGRPGDFFRETGFVRIVPADEADGLRANVAMQVACGAEASVVTGEDLKKLQPSWNVEDVPVAAYEPHSGYGDGATVASDFLWRARELGATYLPSTRVTAIRLHGERVAGVDTDGGIIDAPVVVVALGPWSTPLLSAIGVDLPIEPELHVVAMLKNPASFEGAGFACIDSITTTYFRPEGAAQTLIGDFFGERGPDPDGFPDVAPEEALVDLVRRANHRIPALEEAGVSRGVTGVYDMTPDSRPLLGAAGPEGLYVACGFSGMGFKISPAVGLAVSELIADGTARAVDIRPFRPSRFDEGEPIAGEFEYGYG